MKNKIQIKKILITGGAGYLGSMITTNLVQKGYLVTVVDNLYFKKNFINHLKNNKNLIFIKDDVLKKKKLKKIYSKSGFNYSFSGISRGTLV